MYSEIFVELAMDHFGLGLTESIHFTDTVFNMLQDNILHAIN